MLRRSFSPAGCPGFGGLVVFGRLSRYNRRILRRESAPTEDDILHLLSNLRGAASPREMAEALGKRHAARRALPKLLQRLKKSGLVEEVRRDRFRLAQPKQAKAEGQRETKTGDRETVSPRAHAARFSASDPHVFVGRLVAHRDGYGFVVPDKPREDLDGDLFIPPNQVHDAMHGDRVAARIERRDRARDGRSRAEGRIVRVLDRAHPTVVGLFRYGSSGNFVLPYETRLTQEVVIPPGEELTPDLRAKLGSTTPKPGRAHPRLRELDGAVVQVELTRFPRGGVAPAGRVIEVLGRPGDLGVDVEIMIRKHHLPYKFPDEVLEQARGVALPVSDAERAGRRDFRDLPIVTIDGETARDFDDAVYVERRAGGWRLASAYRRRRALRHAWDCARCRGAPARQLRLFPRSRRAHAARRAFERHLLAKAARRSFGDERTARTGLVRRDHGGGICARRHSFGRAHDIHQRQPRAGRRCRNVRALCCAGPAFRDMRDLALLLNERRTRRGSIDFDLPEPVLVFDEKGAMTSIVRSERNIAHRLIEEFMLAANRAVARFLEERGLASLHRVHEKPDPKKVLEFEELAHAFGYSLGVPGALRAPPAGAAWARGGITSPRARPGIARAAHVRDAAGRARIRDSPAALPTPGAKDRRQARGAHRLLPDAPLAQTGPLRRRPARTFRAGV